MSGRSVTIVFPAFNEEGNIVRSIRWAVQVLGRETEQFEIVVVDDGSRDRTASLVEAEAARDGRIRLVRHDRNRGYGAALASGFRAARMELVFFTDADLQFDLEQLTELLPEAERFDIVAGYRAPRRDPLVRRLNAAGFRAVVRLLHGLAVRDINCAFKVIRREVLEVVELRSTGAFVNAELLLRARARGFRIRELPVRHFPRVHGSQTGARPGVVLQAFGDLLRLSTELRTEQSLTVSRRQERAS